MPSFRIGPLAIGSVAARRLAAGAAAVAVGGGLWLGVATAAPNGPVASVPLEEPGAPGGAGPASQASKQPLRDLLAARARNQNPAAQRRMLVGRFVRENVGGAVIAVAPGQFREVRITPQTRLPKRRPRPGQAVVVLGRPGPGGVFVAGAVLLGKAPTANAGTAAARASAPSAPRLAAGRQPS